MSDLRIQAGVDKVLEFAVQYQAFVGLAAVLTELGSLDDAITAKRQSYEKARADAERMIASAGAARQELDDLNARIATQTEALKTNLQEAIDEADHQAKVIVDTARIEAAKILQDARDQATKILTPAVMVDLDDVAIKSGA